VSGEQWTPYDPATASAASGETEELLPEAPATRPKKPKAATTARTHPWGWLYVVVPLVVVAGGALFVHSTAGEDGVAGLGAPDAQSAAGLAQLLEDVEDRSGGTEVFRAVIYPDYAVVDVPVDGRSQRQESLYWQGDLDEFGGKGTSSHTRVDLAEVDAAVVAEAIATAERLVEDPTTWYVVVDGPTTTFDEGEGDGPTVSGYAGNEFGESGRVVLELDGTERSRYSSVDG
jgi:hypothetical protein